VAASDTRSARSVGVHPPRRLALLKQQGVQIALDDFGTGYGSLADLQKLPVDIVKMDRSFTATIDEEGGGEALLRAIIGLGSALGTRLVAEGIERASQSDLITALGWERGQGYHYGRPSAMASIDPPNVRPSRR
jgi:EAL domain-containing protein (putative c-di-GMP-specific phosphodiesterase class I)